MSIQWPSCFFNLRSSCSSRSNKHQRDCLLPPPRGWLSCRAGLTARPYSHRWPGHPSTHPHPSTVVASPPPGHSLPWSLRRPSRWCSRHGVVNVVNKRQHRKRDVHGEADSWDPHGPWPHASKYLLIRPKRMNTPNDSSDPPAISSHARKCLLITHTKMNTPPASWDPPWWEADLWAY